MPETLIYSNALASPDATAGWVAEGPAVVAPAEGFGGVASMGGAGDTSGALELRSAGDENDHFTLWCPEVFPSRIRVTWEFSPRAEPGLAMLFFAAAGPNGASIFDPNLAPRNGHYPQYHSGDLATLHVSYFRRRWEEERALHTANLRKSPGFHLVAQGADPLPSVADARGEFYRIEVVKDGAEVCFSINDLPLFSWRDDGDTGPRLGAGRIGFRQMAPLVAQYRNLTVWEIHD